MNEVNDRSQLLNVIRAQAVLRGHFTLSSGRHSDYYVDARQVTLSAHGSLLVGRVIFDMIKSNLPDVVAGMTLGADPIVTAVSLISAINGRPMDGLLVRKVSKVHGTGKRIEGPFRQGMSAVVVEDTSTTGASALQAVDVLVEAGVTVSRIVSLIDREEGARLAVESRGMTFTPVFSIREVLAQDVPVSQSARSRQQTVPQLELLTIEQDHDGPTDSSPARPARRMLLMTDGSAIDNPGPAGAGWVLRDEHSEVSRGSEPLGHATNNEAEYRALLLGMEDARSYGATHLTVRMDSTLVVKQVTGKFKTKDARMQLLARRVIAAAQQFDVIKFEQIPREENSIADSLATRASARGR